MVLHLSMVYAEHDVHAIRTLCLLPSNKKTTGVFPSSLAVPTMPLYCCRGFAMRPWFWEASESADTLIAVVPVLVPLGAVIHFMCASFVFSGPMC